MNNFFVELVVYELRFVSLRQTELSKRNECEHEAFHMTVRTITFNDLLKVGIYFISEFSAVASALVRFHLVRSYKNNLIEDPNGRNHTVPDF